jgi:hypothetical protein
MTTKKLDWSRPYGTVVGGDTGAAYYQDGNKFRADGSSIDDEPAEVGAVDVAPEEVDFAPEEESGSVSRAELEALHISVVKKLVAEAGLELETGPGSKARNIDNLLAAG